MKTLLSTLFGFFMILSMNAQVGVNNPTPEQALDVNGKVKLTNDATAPTAGTMRYDATSSDFEGYNGSQWNSFTQSRSSGLPSNAVPVHGYAFSKAPLTTNSIIFKRWSGGASFTQVPDGKFLIVTAIYPKIDGSNPDAKFEVYMGPQPDITLNPFFTNGALYFSGGRSVFYDSGQSILFVMRPDDYLLFDNQSTTNSVAMSVRGFLVDNLNF